MLKVNEGDADRLARAIASGLLVLAGFYLLGGALSIAAYAVAAVLALTAITGFCGLYSLLGISTLGPAKRKGKRS